MFDAHTVGESGVRFRSAAVMDAEPRQVTAPHYGRTAVVLHWITAFALFGQIAFGFLLDEIAPRGTPARTGTINLHKSFGLVLALVIVSRLLWRLSHPPPSLPLTLPDWQRRAAPIGHRALYACMLVMPASGYIASNFSKHGIKLFGFPLAPWGPDNPAVYAFFNGVHIGTAYLFCILIVGHIAMAMKHALIDRDDIFGRIWPRPRHPIA
jgi:cytochrome b561